MRLVLALLLLASPAWGVTFNVTNDAEMTAANAAATGVTNDIIIIANGTYTVGPNPTGNGSGSSNRITYVGNIASPGSVIMPGFDLTKSWVTVKGCSLTSGATFRSSNGSATKQTDDSLAYCRTGAISVYGVGNVTVSNVRATGQTRFDTSNEALDGNHRTTGLVVTDLTASYPLIGDHSYMLLARRVPGAIFTRCKWSGTTDISEQDSRGWFLYNSHGASFTDCRWDFEAEVGAESAPLSQNWVMLRDSCMFVTMTRCTLYAGLQSQQSRTLYLFASGTIGARNDYWQIKDCVFKSWDATWRVQDAVDGWDVSGSTFANRLGTALEFTLAADSTTFRHNTLYSADYSTMLNVAYWTGAGRRTQNIFYANTQTYSGPSCQQGETVWIEQCSGGCSAPTTFASDSNLVWATNNDSTNWLCNASVGRMDANSNAGWGLDTRSRWGTPSFVDTTWASLDLRVSPTGFASGTWWPDGYAGAFSPNSDASAPDAIADLAVTAMANGQATLTWTAPGDDGSAGTASSYDIRYSTSAINSGNFASATPLTGEPSPSVAGSAESWQTDAVLSSGTTYHFAMTASDETANTSDVSNSPSAAMPDYIRPNIPVITARYYAPGTAVVTFTAVGDDSLTGTATSYDLRYGLGTTWWASSALWETAGLQARTYRYDLEGTPKAAGSADSIYVWGLQPGQIYNFMLRVSDEAGNPSGYSNGDTVAIPSQVERDTEPYPRIGIYGGAGASPQIGSYPLTNVAATDIQAAYIDSLARYPVVSLSPNFTDDSSGTAPRHLAFAAIRRLRAVNPAIILLGEPLGNVAYVGNRWSADTAKAFAYYPKIAKALDHATGDSLKFIMSTSGGGQIVTNGSDATTSFLIRKATAPYKHMMWDVERASTFGGQGGTLSNVDITDPRVRDSLTAVNVRHFVSRTDPLTGAYAYDGIMFDLHQPDFYSVVTAEGDTPDWTRLRRGFASRAAFDSAWVESHHLLMRQLRKACIQAGRPDFILTGNSRSGIATATMNGWMREGWPLQQGGSWATNLRWVPGGQANDDAAFGWKPQMSWVFRFINNQVASGDSIPTDSTAYTEQHFRDYRFGLATACLTGARFVLEPSDAALARAGVLPRWYGAWWFDESAAEDGVSGSLKSGVGWLGRPTARFRQTSPLHGSGTGRHNLADSQGGIGDFDDAGDMSSWSLSGSGTQGLVSRVVDTTYAGAGALRLRIGTRQSVDWQAGAFSTQDGNYTNGDTISVEFWGRASGRLPISVGLRDSATGSNRLDTSQGTKVWFDTTWTHHRLIGTVNATFSGAPYFWAGDTTGTWHIDEVRVIRGRPRGGLYYREFDNGIVVVNPYASRDSFVTTRAVRRLVGLTGRASSVNDGTVYANGASIPIAAGDALFLYNDNGDTTPPDAVTDLDTLSCSASTISLTWTAPGDDGSLGTATSYDVRYSTSAATLSAWSGATQASPHAPSGAGDPDSLTIANLSPNTTYYFAIRTSDEVPNESAQSLTLVTTTRASGADATRPGPLSVASVGRGLTSLTLRWTAVGDDSLTGQAQTYDLRRSTSAINAGNFGSATQLTGEPTPGSAGSIEQYVATGLTKNTTYYFGLIVSDEAGLPSALATTSATTRLTAGRLRWYNPWTWIRSLFLP